MWLKETERERKNKHSKHPSLFTRHLSLFMLKCSMQTERGEESGRKRQTERYSQKRERGREIETDREAARDREKQ